MGAALGIIGSLVGIGGGLSQINSQNKANQINEEQIRSQVELEAQKFGWTREQTEAELQRRVASAKNYQDYVDKNFGVTSYDDATKRAEAEYTPLYDQEMKDTLDNVNTGLMARGFFGQAPGAALTQEAAAKVAQAKAGAVGSRANELVENSLSRNLAANQFGISNFGIYGDTNPSGVNPPQVTPPAIGTPVSAVPMVPKPKPKQIYSPANGNGAGGYAGGSGWGGGGYGGNR